jgi:hypothetical protein|tara:strand:- start:2001 stop:2210 length:210 start_codon:yes stop_codon:yes gene_type:complete
MNLSEGSLLTRLPSFGARAGDAEAVREMMANFGIGVEKFKEVTKLRPDGSYCNPYAQNERVGTLFIVDS